MGVVGEVGVCEEGSDWSFSSFVTSKLSSMVERGRGRGRGIREEEEVEGELKVKEESGGDWNNGSEILLRWNVLSFLS